LTAVLVGYTIAPSVVSSFRIFAYQRLNLDIITLYTLAGELVIVTNVNKMLK